MKHVRNFNEFSEINEGIMSALAKLFKRDKDTVKASGNATVSDNSVTFQGKKFTQDQIEYDDYSSTKSVPRVEGGKLIIANPFWSQ